MAWITTISEERAGLKSRGMVHRTREQAVFRGDYTNARTVTEPATRVFIHISVTNPENYSSDDRHARAIEAIGLSRFPATGVSYNRLIMRSGAHYEGQPIGRRGAHTVNDDERATCATSGCPSRGGSVSAPSFNLNYNARAYVICQNVQHTITAAQLDSLARAIAADQLAGFVRKGAPIHGHRCVSDKGCPADRMWALMGELERKINHYLSAGFGAEEDDMELSDRLALSASTQVLIGAPDVSVDNALENGMIAGVLLKKNLNDVLTKLNSIIAVLASTPPGSTVVSSLTDAALTEIAVAVADEQARRQQA